MAYRCDQAIFRGMTDAIRCKVSGSICAHQKYCGMEGRIVLTDGAMRCPARDGNPCWEAEEAEVRKMIRLEEPKTPELVIHAKDIELAQATVDDDGVVVSRYVHADGDVVTIVNRVPEVHPAEKAFPDSGKTGTGTKSKSARTKSGSTKAAGTGRKTGSTGAGKKSAGKKA